MTKLMLTSAGLTNTLLVDNLKQLLDKEISEAKVLFIPTAFVRLGEDCNEEWKYAFAKAGELISVGFRYSNITIYNLDYELSEEEINCIDVIYVCGGNTFYLMHVLRERGFDEIIRRMVERGTVYVGVSAGSIVAGPRIDTALPFDENDIGLDDFSGMRLHETVVIPHYGQNRTQIVQMIKQMLDESLEAITDFEALLVVDGSTEIIGEE